MAASCTGARGIGSALLLCAPLLVPACSALFPPPAPESDTPIDPSGLACAAPTHATTQSDELGREVVCRDSDGRPTGYSIRFDPDGSLNAISAIDADGEARTRISWHRPGGGIVRFDPGSGADDGAWTEWTYDGKLLSRIEARGDMMQGAAVWYYENGNKRMEGRHQADEMTGLWRSWYPSGALYSACEWREGLQHGRCRIWDPVGTLRVDGHYEHGAKAEGWRFWDSHGEPVRSPEDLPPRP